MKVTAVVSLLSGAYFSYTLFYPIAGQSLLYEINNTFKSMTNDFDMVTHGSYNLSSCVKELFNCWELIRTEILCQIMGNDYRYNYWSVCDVIREYCVNVDGPMEVSRGFRMFEKTCADFDHEIIPTLPPEGKY